jgi:MoxR-like ATPase
MKLVVRYPEVESEKSILRNHLEGFDAAEIEKIGLKPVLDATSIHEMQGVARSVRVDEALLGYITDLVRKTREHRSIFVGASPRASIAMLRCSQILAASEGRDFVIPDDIKGLAGAILRHRLTLHPDAEIQGLTADDCIEGIFRDTPVPRVG